MTADAGRARSAQKSTTLPTALRVPGDVAVEMRHALLAARRSWMERILERVPLSVLTLLNCDIVGRLARVTARRKLLQTVGVAGQEPLEFTITDAASRRLAIRLLTEYRDASIQRLATPAATTRERSEASKRAQLLIDCLYDTNHSLPQLHDARWRERRERTQRLASGSTATRRRRRTSACDARTPELAHNVNQSAHEGHI